MYLPKETRVGFEGDSLNRQPVGSFDSSTDAGSAQDDKLCLKVLVMILWPVHWFLSLFPMKKKSDQKTLFSRSAAEWF